MDRDTGDRPDPLKQAVRPRVALIVVIATFLAVLAYVWVYQIFAGPQASNDPCGDVRHLRSTREVDQQACQELIREGKDPGYG
jgi:hypothetical protein